MLKNHADFHVFWGVKKVGSGLHVAVENFLEVVWPHNKKLKCSPNDALSIAPTPVVIRQLQRAETFFVKKVSNSPQKTRPPLRVKKLRKWNPNSLIYQEQRPWRNFWLWGYVHNLHPQFFSSLKYPWSHSDATVTNRAFSSLKLIENIRSLNSQ